MPGKRACRDGGDLRRGRLTTSAMRSATVPGLSVARSGGRGALTSLFPRGGESDYTLVLVDGMRLNAFGGGSTCRSSRSPTSNASRS